MENEVDIRLNKAFFSYTEWTVKITRRNTKERGREPLSVLQASKCQLRLFAERANGVKYNEKVHVGYLFIQHSTPFSPPHKCIFS